MRTVFQDPICLDRSRRKIVFDYDCQSIPNYENQEGFIRNLTKQEPYINFGSIESSVSTEKDEDQQTLKTPMKPDSFSITQEQQQQMYSASSCSSQSPSVPLLVTETPAINACYASKKRKLQFKDI